MAGGRPLLHVKTAPRGRDGSLILLSTPRDKSEYQPKTWEPVQGLCLCVVCGGVPPVNVRLRKVIVLVLFWQELFSL